MAHEVLFLLNKMSKTKIELFETFRLTRNSRKQPRSLASGRIVYQLITAGTQLAGPCQSRTLLVVFSVVQVKRSR